MPTMVKMYHKKDGEVEMTSVNADHAATFPDEWSRKPWPLETKPVEETKDPAPEYVAAHRGGGSWAVMKGDEVVEGGLTKEEAEAGAAKRMLSPNEETKDPAPAA